MAGSQTRMPEVLIIGAGAIGCSIARELAQRGVRDVLVLDRGAAGDGSSSRAAGGLRAQFGTAFNIRSTQLSQDVFRNARETLGGDIDYREDGYIFLARSAQQAEVFRQNVAIQRSLGVDVDWLSPDDLETRWPWMRLDGVHAASWCPTDCVFDQRLYMDLLIARTRDAGAGVEIREHTPVLRLVQASDGSGRVIGVETPDGIIQAGTTILAAGAWSSPLTAPLGLELAISPLRREIYTTVPVAGLPEQLPFIADFDNGTYIRRDAHGFRIAGQRDPNDDLTQDRPVNLANAATATAWAGALVPALAGATITGGWAGMTEITPDHHALLGGVPGLDGLILATGFSGHGVMHAPVTGVLISELLLDGAATTLDITPLDALRFAEGRALTETMIARRGTPTDADPATASTPATNFEQGDIVATPRGSASADMHTTTTEGTEGRG